MLIKRVRLAVSLRSSVCAVALLTGGVAHAQTPAEPGDVDEIVVTGSRVVRDGYQSPTPVSVVGRDEIARSATPNVADFVNTLPAVSGSSTPTTSATNIGQARQGINSINLRGIGDVRTLTLLDGRRVGGAINTGVADVSEFPQQLISRVDVVTGGASASYGSDALSGVVNFVLDTKFTGVKGEISGGETTYGDNKTWKADLSFGSGFAGGRGHVLLSGEASREAGIITNTRDWNKTGWAFINNPDYKAGNGQPQVLRLPKVALSTATLGGAIACSKTSACASLRGIAFGPGGTMYNLVFGPVVSDPIMAGGTYDQNAIRDKSTSLTPRQTRRNLFTRVSYDIADDWNVFAEASWSHLDSYSEVFRGNLTNNLTVRVDNPYMPAELASRIRALGLTSVPFGTMKGDNPVTAGEISHGYFRGVGGIDGKFDAFGTNWKLSSYFEFSRATLTNTSKNSTRLPNFMKAIDAVRAPNGSIVCRSTLTDPTNGCVPYNLFGTGVNSAEAVAYVTGSPFQKSVFKESVISLNIAGEPFSIWAGPVSVAFGAEHRTESADGFADPITQQSTGNWDSTGGLPTIGEYKVSDAYIETVVPLAKDSAWARSLDINAAVRAVKYDTGTYAPWKIGAEYAPAFEGIRFRGVYSKDVREANLADRYAGVFQNQGSFTDPNNNGAVTSARGLNSGNPDLEPEIAKTLSFGAVVQPTFLPGFIASVDYYKVHITGAIGSLTIQQIVNLCYAGNDSACALIVRTPGATNQYDVNIVPLNLASERTRGVDLEAAYRFDVADVFDGLDGAVTVRGLATHYIKYSVDSGLPGSIVTERVGATGLPKWRYQVSINYDNGPLSLTGTMRGVSAGVVNNAFIECTVGCPLSTANNPTYSDIHIDGATYFDFAATYRFGEDRRYEAFFNVRNLANKDPAVVPNGPSGNPYRSPAIDQSQYDVLGRVFRAGFRFKM